MTNEVAELLQALREGTLTLDDVGQRFRERRWPRRRQPLISTHLEITTDELQDPDPYIPESFDDVTAAYHRGELSDVEYDALAAAMAESKRAEDARSKRTE